MLKERRVPVKIGGKINKIIGMWKHGEKLKIKALYLCFVAAKGPDTSVLITQLAGPTAATLTGVTHLYGRPTA